MIRTAQTKDEQKLKELYRACFADTEMFVAHFFSDIYQPGNTLVWEEGGELLSMVHMLPYQVRIKGYELPAGYVAAVATLPESRNRGLAEQLMRRAEAEMRCRGDALALLMPFRFSFYRKFGYENCSYLQRIRCTKQQLTLYQSGTFVESSDIAKLNVYYERFHESQYFWLQRSTQEWNHLLFDLQQADGTVYQSEDGYCMVCRKKDTLLVLEYCMLTKEGLRNMLGFLGELARTEVELRGPEDTRLRELLCEVDIPISIEPHLMAMVLDEKRVAQVTGIDRETQPIGQYTLDALHHGENNDINFVGWIE